MPRQTRNIPMRVLLLDAVAMSMIMPTLPFVGRNFAGIKSTNFTDAGGYMPDLTPKDKRASASGIAAGTLALGMVICRAIEGYVAGFGLRASSVVATALSALNIAVVWLRLPEPLAKKKRRTFEAARANPVGAFAEIKGDTALRKLVFAIFVFAITTAVFPAIWPYCNVEAFGFSPPMTGMSYTALGLAMAAALGLLVRASVKIFSEVPTVRYAILCGVCTLLALSTVTGGRVFLAMIAVTFVVAPTIQGMMSNRLGDDCQSELMGLFASITAMSMMVGPVLMSFVFRTFTNPKPIIYAPSAPFVAAAVLVGIALFLFDVPNIRAADPVSPQLTAAEGN